MLKKCKYIVMASVFACVPFSALAASSTNYRIDESVVNAAGNTYTGTSNNVLDSFGESIIGQIWGSAYSIQSGFFNAYFLLPSTPTVTPTVTVTSTPIRTFDGEIMHKSYVFAAPNPITGHRGNIHFDLAMPAKVDLKIFTPQSKLVLSRHWDQLPAGTNYWTWNTSNLANGVYFLYLKAQSGNETTIIKKKLAVIK